MAFWDTFQTVISQTWNILNTDMNIGGVSFSFVDVLVVGGVCTVAGFIVWEVVEDY